MSALALIDGNSFYCSCERVFDAKLERLAECGSLARRRGHGSFMVPGVGPRKLLAKSVEPLPNSVGVTAVSFAAGLVFGSGHWRCSIPGEP